MGSIEPLIVLPVAALHLAVMPWRIGADYLVPDAMLLQTHLEKGGLVRMVVWPSGEATQRLDGAVITAFPAVDILPVRLVLDSGFRNLIFVSVFNKG